MKKIQMIISENALFKRNEIPGQQVTLSKTNFKSSESIMINAFENKN